MTEKDSQSNAPEETEEARVVAKEAGVVAQEAGVVAKEADPDATMKIEPKPARKVKTKKAEVSGHHPGPSAWRSFVVVWKKESAGFFYSPVAYIILGGFALLVAWLFFDQFWLRNEASVRPLFASMPLLFLMITPLLTMRSWAEERSTGTADQLFSLPVSLPILALGKAAACLGVLLLALAITLPYPIMAESMGNLDWGPVLGGYIAAILLGSAYVSIGLFLSAMTRTQIEAAFLTFFVAGLLYFIGEPFFLDRMENPQLVLMLTRMGLGSRFSSIARGVLDLRDLLYYVSITAFFVMLNVAVLRHRKWL
ncbi:ABC transporter permease [Myxococcota bacterium]|nr:ABC transporter permease [Myxococcota bacterium]MBU1412723.1 ABC transporter permease [Myxococcota bacterium]MBU1510204.1 ABC transporter permease [Myxococcota bacterium]